MILFVIGGSGSGKSEYAESRILESGLPEPVYVATMQPFGEEGRKRIARHRKLRQGKGFLTEERQTDLRGISGTEGKAVLLEDLTNLFANEWFSVGEDGAMDRVLEGIEKLKQQSALTVIVGNDVFSDGICYDESTQRYLMALAELNRKTAALSDEVVEVVCGIPVCRKENKQ